MILWVLLAWVALTTAALALAIYAAPELAYPVRQFRLRLRRRRGRKNAVPLKEVLLAAAEKGVFHPSVFYNEDGDMFEVCWANPPSGYRQYVNGALTLYREADTEAITGCVISGVHDILHDGTSCPDHSPQRCETREVY